MFSAFNPSKCTHTWSSGQPTLRRPGSSWGFGALLKGLTSVPARAGIRTHNLGLPRVSSPTLYLLGHDCPTKCWVMTLTGDLCGQITHNFVIKIRSVVNDQSGL